MHLYAHNAFLVIAAVFAYHSFLIWRISKNDVLIPYKGVVGMSLSATVFYFLYASYEFTRDQTVLQSIPHFLWVFGLLVLYFNVVALQSYLVVRIAWLDWSKRIVLALSGVAFVLWIIYVSAGQLILISGQSMHPGPLMMPEHVKNSFSPNLMTVFFSANVFVIEVSCFSIFLWHIWVRRLDYWLFFGVALSIVAIMNEVLLVWIAPEFGFSFLFVANFVEIVRLTQLISREKGIRSRRLEHSVRLAQLGELAATVVHEINTPLTAVMMNAQIGMKFIDASEKEKSEVHKHFENILLASRKIAGIAQSLRTHAFEEPSKSEGLDLVNSVRSAIRMLEPLCAQDGVAVEFDFDDHLPNLSIDSGRFQQVIVNLVQNSRDATQGLVDPKIQISAEAEAEYVWITVKDNGCGISEANIGQVFRPFFSTKPLGYGTGIGLTFVAAQVESWNARIEVDSKVGEGTVFRIRIPFVS